MMSENCAKIYIIEIKIVTSFSLARAVEKKGELKNEADIL
jgi:hypothetical protein